MAESALVILVPEAEPLVGSFRARHDPSAAEGVPAHVTLLYPFAAPDQIDATALDALRALFAPIMPFDFALTAARRLGDSVLYLAPEPAEPFRQLTFAIWHRFPKTPPYGAQHADIAPHLTVAQIADAATLNRVAAGFADAAHERLPIEASATEVSLLDNRTGRWQTNTTFPLGGI
ncbi:2'-5' RNA ligase family protein [Desertibaculum subflavum]|uniref:2'-5' RNA ligase family protein n=1 Tax=Desertibaculum subflavum TaxID=2268458 RepID=UPI000E66ED8C